MIISYHPTMHPLLSPPFRDHGCASSCTHTWHRLVVTRSHFLNRCESSWDMANITKFHINAMEMQRHRFRIDLQQALSPFCFTLQSMICYIIAKYIEILIKLVLYRLQVPDRTTQNWGTIYLALFCDHHRRTLVHPCFLSPRHHLLLYLRLLRRQSQFLPWNPMRINQAFAK
jgi:hypothetical protein